MKSAIVNSFGPPMDVVRVVERKHQPLASGQVRLKMLRATINPSDLLVISGRYRYRTTLPFFPGFEGVGIVVETSDSLTSLHDGDRVVPIRGAGMWQQERIADAKWCFRVPGDLSDEQASYSYVNPLSSIMLIDMAMPRVGQRVAINAPTSAIGQILARLVSQRECIPIAIESRIATRSKVLDHSLADVWVSSSGSAKVDIAFDAIGGEEGGALLESVHEGGTFIQYGLMSGRPVDSKFIRNARCSTKHFMLRDFIRGSDRAIVVKAMNRAFGLVSSGLASQNFCKYYVLEDIRQALRHSGQRNRGGKVGLLLSK
jgi:NADPH:quinone reductase-like Zn-dependent oxidoreductase